MSLFGRTPPRDSQRNQEPETPQAPDLLTKLGQRLEEASLPEAARQAALQELERLARTDPSHGEYTVGVSYLEFLLDLPWRRSVRERLDLPAAAVILDREHHGLASVKDRVLDHLAATILSKQAAARILVVDDEEISRANMAHSLQKEGHTVETAPDGFHALEMIKAEEFDLLITDMKMQGMDGLELIRQVTEVSPRTGCIVVTGFATVETAVDALKQGAVNYLAKPLNLDRLREAARDVLAKGRESRSRQAPIMCFTGPPGTGKTSVGRAIATALDLPFARFSLAGMRDEAELRGHRRTYVGAMAGRILNELRRLDCNNRVLMLDEIDKVGQDFRGDPASALLEVLDPEQNRNFVDNYLEVPFDLSRVLFITTANTPERLPRPLLDRMEFVHFSSYTMPEKTDIGLIHLLPRQLESAGLRADQVTVTREAMSRIAADYTQEAGVRNLERTIGRVCRKLARKVLTGEVQPPVEVHAGDIPAYLGRAQQQWALGTGDPVPGVATGLVFSETGGHVVQVESAHMPGTGRLIMTGSLGRVLRESAQTALSHIRSRAKDYGVPEDVLHGRDIHIHIPGGATPKDGPSAGVTIAAALVSLLTGRLFRADTAMTGELTLSGRILPVGGLREKILAAAQSGRTRVILPEGVREMLDELDGEVRGAAELVLVDDVASAVRECLEESG